ncbi:hypothetical protein RUND412_004432 [Rhizina undulata]
MAARIIKEDLLLRKDRHKRAEESRRILTSELHTLGTSLDLELRDRITTIHANAAALENQSKTLKNRTNALSKTTRQWGGIADGARGRLKEIGDIQNWAEIIEHDLLVIEETLRIVHEDDHESARG